MSENYDYDSKGGSEGFGDVDTARLAKSSSKRRRTQTTTTKQIPEDDGMKWKELDLSVED